MTPGQWAYLAALSGLFILRGPNFAAWVLLANAVVTLGVLALMDFGLIGDTQKTVFLMLVDFASGAVLVMVPGIPRLLAVGYAVLVPVYAASVWFSIAETTTFAIVIGIGFFQIAVAAIGYGGGDGGAFRRPSDVLGSVPSSDRIAVLGVGGMAEGDILLSPHGRGLRSGE